MVGGRLILANSLGEVAAVNPTNGEVIESRDIGGEIFIPPIAANGAIYIVNDDARLTILR
jgi:outer membrane protein assembly factor BamB